MDTYDAAVLALQTKQVALTGEWRANYADATVAVRQGFDQLISAGRAMTATGAEYAAKLKQLRDDDLMYPEGRDRLLESTAAEARLKMNKLDETQRNVLAFMDRELTVTCLPKMPPGREMAARDEARMILDGSPDPAQTMGELAVRHDELAAAIVGSYGESYLRAKGMSPKDAAEDHSLVQMQAVGAARNSADPAVVAAANAYGALPKLQGLAAVQREVAWTPLDEAGVRR
jgi:hypothetical protein